MYNAIYPQYLRDRPADPAVDQSTYCFPVTVAHWTQILSAPLFHHHVFFCQHRGLSVKDEVVMVAVQQFHGVMLIV